MNIDKDIEILKEKIRLSKFNLETMIDNKAENETLEYCGNVVLKDCINVMENTLSELETYKKIAEKLSYEIVNYEDTICTDFISYEDCKYKNGGKWNLDTCLQCVIDWARKEVEKDGE